MNYQVQLSNTAKKFLKNLPKKEAISVISTLTLLGNNPRIHGAIKLANRDNEYRIKTGIYSQFRIIYTIQDKEIFVYVIDILDRKDAYKKK